MLRLLAILTLLPLLSRPAPADEFRVQVERTAVHRARSKFSPVLASLSYGQPVEGTAADDWIEVELEDGRTGFVHRSALAPPERIEAVAGTSDAASPEALAAAVRGLQKKAEDEATAGGGFDYAAVDRLEAGSEVDEATIARFRASGGLDGSVQEPRRPTPGPVPGETPADEYGYGRAAVALFLDGSPGLDEHAGRTGYLARVGRTVAAASGRPDLYGGWTFGVVDDDSINAFAAPGGFVLVTRGALTAAASEDELAAILAHEVAHVVLDHPVLALRQAEDPPGRPGRLRPGRRPRPERSRRLDPARARGLGELLENGHDRTQEADADRMAVEILAAAGYDPTALGRFLSRLDDPATGLGDRLRSDHWRPARRVATAEGHRRLEGLEAVEIPAARIERWTAASGR